MAYNNRRENLRRLIEQWGGPSTLAQKLGYSNASFLVQMAGPNPTRDVSERTARKIEQTLDLPEGALDGHPVSKGPKVSAKLLTEIVILVGKEAEKAGVKLAPTKLADLVTFIYQDAEANGGSIRVSFATQLLRLLK